MTDANLVLGRLDPAFFHGGHTTLDLAGARAAVRAVADRLDLSLEEAALGIVKVVNANMVKGIATVTVQRGIDVRDFALLSFGGAGGLHAVDLARELEMSEAIIPPQPGVFSAIGLLVADVRRDFVNALGGIVSSAADAADLERRFQSMEDTARQSLRSDGFSEAAIRLVRSADLKVAGQTYELTVRLPQQGPMSAASILALVDAFGRLYRERYAFFFEHEPIELVNLRLAAFGLNDTIDLKCFTPRSPDGGGGSRRVRPVYFDGMGYVETSIIKRDELQPGRQLSGPAVIEEATSSTLLPPGATANVAADLGLFVKL